MPKTFEQWWDEQDALWNMVIKMVAKKAWYAAIEIPDDCPLEDAPDPQKARMTCIYLHRDDCDYWVPDLEGIKVVIVDLPKEFEGN